MARNKHFILFVFLLFFVSCRFSNTDAVKDQEKAKISESLSIPGEFSISGAYALYPLVQKWADDFMNIYHDVKIEVRKCGTGHGIEDLLADSSQLAMVSRPLTDEELNIGLWSIPVAKDGVVPIVNSNNPYINDIMNHGLSPDEFLKIFTGDQPPAWSDFFGKKNGDKVKVFIRSDESGASSVFADFLYKKTTDLKGTGVNGDEAMIRIIQENPLSIGFCNLSYAFDTVSGNLVKDIQLVPADLDFDNTIDRKELTFDNLEKAHRELWLGLYPRNLCRELRIVATKMPDDDAIVAFLRYVLTEGQKDVKESGFCRLNNAYIKNSLEKLENTGN